MNCLYNLLIEMTQCFFSNSGDPEDNKYHVYTLKKIGKWKEDEEEEE